MYRANEFDIARLHTFYDSEILTSGMQKYKIKIDSVLGSDTGNDAV
jgi:hypothetical protein